MCDSDDDFGPSDPFDRSSQSCACIRLRRAHEPSLEPAPVVLYSGVQHHSDQLNQYLYALFHGAWEAQLDEDRGTLFESRHKTER